MKAIKGVFQIIEKRGAMLKDVWRRVGTGYPNKDGSLTIVLDSIPLSGRMVVKDLYGEQDNEKGKDNETNF